MLNFNCKGTGVALITPFKNDLSVDYNALEKVVNHVTENNVDYLVVMGTTGESVTLNSQEKKNVLDFVIDINKSKLPIVYGIGGNNTAQVVDTLKNADLINVAAILSVSPAYNKPNQEGIYQHFKMVAEASEKPVILYNVPGRTGSNMSASTILRLANDFKNIIAIKEAGGDFTQIMNVIKYKPEGFQVISGDDALTLPMIAVGAEGAISVVANAFPGIFSEMIRLALQEKMKEAQAKHYLLTDVISTLFEEGSPAGVKAALSILGIGSENIRMPLVPLTKQTRDKLEKQIREIS